jgi:hypothetical protein
MDWAVGFLVVIGGLVLFFTWANRMTAKSHARFTPKDVEAALVEFVSPESRYHDDWDLFLSWPIDDPRLESIRQECVRIAVGSSDERDREAVRRVEEILVQLRHDA